MSLGRVVIILGWIVVAVGVTLVVGYALTIVGFGVLLGAGTSAYAYIVRPSPDRTISLVTRIAFGGATSTAREDVYLVGGDFRPQAELGSYFHGGAEIGDGWRGAREVNVCMLRYPFEKAADAADATAKVTTASGQIATVRVTKRCPPEVLRAWNWRWD